MDSIFLTLQNFTIISYIAFATVLMSFLIEFKSNSPYKSLLFSNIGFGIYYFSLLNGSEIDFPMYFMLLSFLICTWFFVLKNIEEEEDEDRGFLRNYDSDNIVAYNGMIDENGKVNSSLSKHPLFNFTNVLCMQISKLVQNKFILFIIHFSKNETVYYKHAQRKLVLVFTYLILIAILVSFFVI